MFEQVLTQHASPADTIRWFPAMAGLRVCDFTVDWPAQPSLSPAAGCCEALFCRGGNLRIVPEDGRQFVVGRGDILLVSDLCRVRQAQGFGEPLRGILVAVRAGEGGERLAGLQALPGNAPPDLRRLGPTLSEKAGVLRISGGAWRDALYSALSRLPREEQGQYCALKTVELLYLLCRRCLPETRAPDARTEEQDPADLVDRLNDYIQTHLAEELSIAALSQQFHISPTTLKAWARRSYGQPLHQYISAARIERAAALLRSTPFPIAQIAAEVGYSSVSQFGTMFRRRFQCSPAQYRHQSQDRPHSLK